MMGYIPPPRPLYYPMTRNSVPPPPPPKRIIREDAPLLFKPKKKAKEMKLEVLSHALEGDTLIIRYGNADGYRTMKVGRHGSLTDVDINEALEQIVEQKDLAEVKKLYSPYLSPSYSSKEEWFGKIVVDESKKYCNRVTKYADAADYYKKLSTNQKEQIEKPKFPPNMLINESTGKVTYDVDDRVIVEQAQADHHAEWGNHAPSKSEWYDIFPEKRKKKSLWERIIDRIIKNIVWGK
jgi:hypothetical protein